MRPLTSMLPIALLAACGQQQSGNQPLQNAAEQSDPAAAEVLNGAAANGMDPQQALEEAGNAAAANASTNSDVRMQARPNSAQDPNPPAAGQPPEKVAVNSQ